MEFDTEDPSPVLSNLVRLFKLPRITFVYYLLNIVLIVLSIYKSNSKKPMTLSFILSVFLSFISNFPDGVILQRKARVSAPKR